MFSLLEIEEIAKKSLGREPSYSELRCICFDDKSDEKRLRAIVELMTINKEIERQIKEERPA